MTLVRGLIWVGLGLPENLWDDDGREPVERRTVLYRAGHMAVWNTRLGVVFGGHFMRDLAG